MALAGCWLVLIAGVAGVMVTGSAAVPLVTVLLLVVAVVGGDPVVGARRGRGVARRGGHAAGSGSVSVSVNSGVPVPFELL